MPMTEVEKIAYAHEMTCNLLFTSSLSEIKIEKRPISSINDIHTVEDLENMTGYSVFDFEKFPAIRQRFISNNLTPFNQMQIHGPHYNAWEHYSVLDNIQARSFMRWDSDLQQYDLLVKDAARVAIQDELDQCRDGYKKVLPWSEMEFDGGYSFVKLYLIQHPSYKAIYYIFKVSFLTPTQSQFDKNEGRLEIHKYPYFDHQTIDVGLPEPSTWYGFYSEEGELRCLWDTSWQEEQPNGINYMLDSLDKMQYEMNTTPAFSSQVMGDSYPLLKTIAMQENPRYGVMRYGISLNGELIFNISELVRMYVETQKAIQSGKKLPIKYQVYTFDRTRVKGFDIIE